MIVIIGRKKYKALLERIDDLERRSQNVEVEVFEPMADAQMPDKTIKRRVTLKGIVNVLYKKSMGINPKEKKPLIQRV